MSKALFALIFTLFAMGLAVVWIINKPDMQPLKTIDYGLPQGKMVEEAGAATTEKFYTIDNRPFQLSDYEGKVVVLNLWATWCPPCIAEFPSLLELAQAHPEDIVVIALSSDMNEPALRKFLTNVADKNRDLYPAENVVIGWDVNGEKTRELFENVGLPETLLIDRTGHYKWRLLGPELRWTEGLVYERIRGLITATPETALLESAPQESDPD